MSDAILHLIKQYSETTREFMPASVSCHSTTFVLLHPSENRTSCAAAVKRNHNALHEGLHTPGFRPASVHVAI